MTIISNETTITDVKILVTRTIKRKFYLSIIVPASIDYARVIRFKEKSGAEMVKLIITDGKDMNLVYKYSRMPRFVTVG